MCFVLKLDAGPFPAIRYSPFASVYFCSMHKGLQCVALSIGKKYDQGFLGLPFHPVAFALVRDLLLGLLSGGQ
jgi:hypothetical protein